MKKKGFTLVELLAVIAILAILVIIALPNVLSMYNEAKKNTFVTEARKLYSGAKEKWMLNQSSGIATFSNVEGITGATKLSIEGSQSNQYFIQIDPAGNVTRFLVTNKTYALDITNTNGIEVQKIGTADDGGYGEAFDAENTFTLKLSDDKTTASLDGAKKTK